MALPKNGDSINDAECPNCEMIYDEEIKIGTWQNCKEENGGCGLICKLTIKTGKLETE